MNFVGLLLLFVPPISANECGKPSSVPNQGGTESRIVSGYDVGYYKYPWYTALLVQNTIACGGALIGPKTVITAAHCYRSFLKSNKTLEDVYTVLLGVYNKCEKESSQKKFGVVKVHIHEKFEEMSPYYDIAMLLLKEDTTEYQPICLPPPMERTPKEGTVPGLGTMKYHGATPCTLQEARLLIYSDDTCRLMINRTGNDPGKLFGAFCAGYLQGGIDTCQGDSGGPLQIQNDQGNIILMGVVSFGFHCANPGFLGVYTNVSTYLPWILEKSGLQNSQENNTTEAISSTSVDTSTTQLLPPTELSPTEVISTGGVDSAPPLYHYDLLPYQYIRRPLIHIIIMDRKNKGKSHTQNKLKLDRKNKKTTRN